MSPACQSSHLTLLANDSSFLQEIVPRVRRLAVMADGNPDTILETSAVQAAARTLGLDVVTMNIRRAEEIAPAFDTIKGRVDALTRNFCADYYNGNVP